MLGNPPFIVLGYYVMAIKQIITLVIYYSNIFLIFKWTIKKNDYIFPSNVII